MSWLMSTRQISTIASHSPVSGTSLSCLTEVLIHMFTKRLELRSTHPNSAGSFLHFNLCRDNGKVASFFLVFFCGNLKTPSRPMDLHRLCLTARQLGDVLFPSRKIQYVLLDARHDHIVRVRSEPFPSRHVNSNLYLMAQEQVEWSGCWRGHNCYNKRHWPALPAKPGRSAEIKGPSGVWLSKFPAGEHVSARSSLAAAAVASHRFEVRIMEVRRLCPTRQRERHGSDTTAARLT